MSRARITSLRVSSALALLLAPLSAAVMPPSQGVLVSSLLAVVFAIVVASTVDRATVVRSGLCIARQTRTALGRATPVAAQSDPDARGHARPRAPGGLLPAV